MTDDNGVLTRPPAPQSMQDRIAELEIRLKAQQSEDEVMRAFASAICKAQIAMGKLVKTAENDAFKKGGKALKYATLADVLNTIMEPFNMAGIAIVQTPDVVNVAGADGAAVPAVRILTILMHESGHRMEFNLHMRVAQNTPQGIGATITYARRYALMAIAGVAPEDDDGNLASNNKGPLNAERERLTEGDIMEVANLATEVGADMEKLLKYLKVSRLDEVYRDDLNEVKRLLEAKRTKA